MAPRWLRLPDPQEAHDDTGLIARVVGVLYGAGAWLIVISLLLPHPEKSNDAAIYAIAVTAGLICLALFFVGHRLPALALQLVIALGSVLIGLCVYFAGQPSVYGSMYVWVVLSSAFFFPGRSTLFQVIWLLAVDAVAVYSLPSSGFSPLTQLLLSAIVFGTAAAVVSWLSESTNRRVEASESRARTDPLTGIANRRWLDEEVSRELTWARRHGTPLCAAILDLDDLKRFNDEHGHAAGDRLLVSAVTAWTEAIRPSDLIARVGGDEFMVLMPDCSAESSKTVLARLQAATPSGASCSAGLALWDGVESTDQLFQRADQALYAAKKGGGAQVVFIDERPGVPTAPPRLSRRDPAADQI
jgi:diguanylate cyclase (GGDEF)-like protein